MVAVAKCTLPCSWLLIQEMKLVRTDWLVLTVHTLDSAKGQTFTPYLPSYLRSLQLDLPPKVSTISSSFLWLLLLWGGQGRGEIPGAILGLIAIYSAFVAVTERCEKTICFW